MELGGIDKHVVVKSNEQDDWSIILLIALYVFGISSLVKISPSVDLGIAINKFGFATEVIHNGQSEGVVEHHVWRDCRNSRIMRGVSGARLIFVLSP